MGENLDLRKCGNCGYLCTTNGWFKTFEITFGLSIFLCLVIWQHSCGTSYTHFLLLTSFCFTTMTSLFLTSFIISSTSQAFTSTIVFINFNLLGFVFYFSGSLTALIRGNAYETQRGLFLAAGLLGLTAGTLHLVDALLAIRLKLRKDNPLFVN
ncbi:hypothetical protein BIW11_08911 [Tropilaelaps mercedesae]|uniref:MARVEL domain-containing protein n=1 Tax=Tropilaelaps mercedesae TaxID=418985 RepID=A0A1V9XMD2_9ACAR|nr:hypothetical protein BIW11_08911 [Tropilaelaps mercedesae]